MNLKNWYKLIFGIDSNLEDIIIWKLNDLGINTYSFEYLLNTKNERNVIIWLLKENWNESKRNNLELEISKLFNIQCSFNKFFKWTVIEEEDWLNSWKKYWGPELIGNNLVILPCWMKTKNEYINKKIIKIDPGAAFGTGSHPSTYLCLERMENIFFSGKKVLDIGSGSGILSVTAAFLGAKEICAVDNDYLAINSTKSNFHLNFGSLDTLDTYLGSFSEVFRENSFNNFDIVLCNILAEVIKDIIPFITSSLRNNGEVILSGILNSQKDEIMTKLNQNYLKIIDVSSKKDWVCIAAQKFSNQTNA